MLGGSIGNSTRNVDSLIHRNATNGNVDNNSAVNQGKFRVADFDANTTQLVKSLHDVLLGFLRALAGSILIRANRRLQGIDVVTGIHDSADVLIAESCNSLRGGLIAFGNQVFDSLLTAISNLSGVVSESAGGKHTGHDNASDSRNELLEFHFDTTSFSIDFWPGFFPTIIRTLAG